MEGVIVIKHNTPFSQKGSALRMSVASYAETQSKVCACENIEKANSHSKWRLGFQFVSDKLKQPKFIISWYSSKQK